MIWVWVRMWRMETVPGHGLCTANREAARPIDRIFQFLSQLLYPAHFLFENLSLVDFKVGMSIIRRMALIPYFESRSVVDFTY